MRRSFWNGIAVSMLALPAMSGAAQAQVFDNDGCSNATLQGDYAFSVRGALLGLVIAGNPRYFSSPVLLDAVAMSNFDGRGKFTQVGINVVDGVVPMGPTDPKTGFGIDQSGSYTVFPDCTGNFELDLEGHISIAANSSSPKTGEKFMP